MPSRSEALKKSQLKYFEANKTAIQKQINQRRRNNYDEVQQEMRKLIYHENLGKYARFRKLFMEDYR